jgi:hypothetical protein
MRCLSGRGEVTLATAGRSAPRTIYLMSARFSAPNSTRQLPYHLCVIYDPPTIDLGRLPPLNDMAIRHYLLVGITLLSNQVIRLQYITGR